MAMDRTSEYLVGLVNELRKLPKETEFVEFKHNNDDHQEIGEYLSALANSAALSGKSQAYLIWGIDDQTHEVVGTTFLPAAKKIGNEELESWLLHLLEPKIDFDFYTVEVDSRPVVLLEIGRAFRHPVRFSGQEYIRIGSYKKKLKDFPEKERKLWRAFDKTHFEDGLAAEHVSADEVLRLLDYPAFFDLLEQPLPADRSGILEALADEGLIRSCDAGDWDSYKSGRGAVRKTIG